MAKGPNFAPVVENRKARFNYHILDSVEAGIALSGPEVKAIREGKADLTGSFARVENGEVFLYDMNIGLYSHLSPREYVPTRPRKLLLHCAQIRRLAAQVAPKGFTLVPLELYFNEKGRVKVRLAVGQGKLARDRRQDIKKKITDREMDRAIKKRKGG